MASDVTVIGLSPRTVDSYDLIIAADIALAEACQVLTELGAHVSTIQADLATEAMF